MCAPLRSTRATACWSTATIAPINVLDGSRIVSVPAGLSVFRVGDDGTLGFVRTHDVETNGKFQWWMGMVGSAWKRLTGSRPEGISDE